MTEIAALGLGIDSGSVKTATSDLDAFVRKAGEAETAAERAGSGASQAFGRIPAPAKQATAEVERARNSMGRFVRSGGEAEAAARGAASGFQLAAIEALKAQAAISSAASGMTGFAGALRAAAPALIGFFAIDRVLAFGGAVIESARAFEMVQSRMEFVAGSASAAQVEMQRAAQMADRLAVSERSVLDIRAKMIPLEQAGAISRANSLALTSGLIDASKALGASQEQLGSVMYGLGQALSQNIVRAEEFNQVTEPLPGLTLHLDRAIQSMTGNATANFRTMINNGEITRDLFATAMVRALGAFEGAGEKSLNTIDGAMIRLGNSWDRFKRNLVDNEIVIAALGAITLAVDGLNAALGEGAARAETLEDRFFSAQAAAFAAQRQMAAAAQVQADAALLDTPTNAAAWQDPEAFGVERYLANNPALNPAINPTADVTRVADALTANANFAANAARQAIAQMSLLHREMDKAAEVEELAQMRARLAEMARQDEMTRGALGDFRGKGESERRQAELDTLKRQEAETIDLYLRKRIPEEEHNHTLRRIAEERAKIQEAIDKANAPKPAARNAAQDAEDARRHAQAMLDAAKLGEEAARRNAEIRLLSTQAADRSGYVTGSAEYQRVLAAEAERMRLDDLRKKTEDDRREADAIAKRARDEADREAKRSTEEQTRHREAAVQRMAQFDAEAAQAREALGVSQAAAAQAASATTIEEIQRIEAAAEASRRRLAVQDAGQKAYDALDKGATNTEREAARAQAEATERAKQQAQIDGERLGIARALLETQADAARAMEAAQRSAALLGEARGAQSRAEFEAMQAQAAHAERIADADRLAKEARVRLGKEATAAERDLAEAASRALSVQQEEVRLAQEALRITGTLVDMRERASDAIARGALAMRAGEAALAASSRAEISAIQLRADAQARALDLTKAIADAQARLGAEALPWQIAEAEAHERSLAAAKEHERIGRLLTAQAQTLAGLREASAQAMASAVIQERLRAEAIAAGSVVDLGAARKRAEADARALDRAEAIRRARESMGVEADPIRVQDAERLAAAAWDHADAARQTNEAIERRAALLKFEADLSNRRLDAERGLAAFIAATGSVEDRIRAAEHEAEVQAAIRQAREQQLEISEAAIRAQVAQTRESSRALEVEQARARNAEAHAREAQRIRDLTAATLRGPAALRAEEARHAGISAGYSNSDDPNASRNALEIVRLQEQLDLAAKAREALTAANDNYGESALRIREADAEVLRLAPYLVEAANSQAEAERALAQARMSALVQVSPLYAQAQEAARAVLAQDPHQRLNDFRAREVETRRAIDAALRAQGVALERLGPLGEQTYQQMQAAAAGFGDTASSVSAMLSNGLDSVIFKANSLGDAFRGAALEFSKMVLSRATNPLMNFAGNAVSGWMGGLNLAAANGAVFDMRDVTPFAKGDVFGAPTFFGYGGGKTGVMGEAGPEAIMPLKRMASGKLGVEMVGGEGAGVYAPTINAPITINAAPGADPRAIAQAVGAELDRREKAAQAKRGGYAMSQQQAARTAASLVSRAARNR